MHHSFHAGCEVSDHFMNISQFTPELEPASWDFFRATIKERHWNSVKELIPDLYEKVDAEESKGFYGYEKALHLKKSGDRVLTVYKGGNSGTVCLESSGSMSGTLRDMLLASRVDFRPSRMDACLDYDEEGLADALLSFGLAFAADNDLKINQQGDWHRGRARTLYIGSRSSPVFLRIYEKGHKAIDEGSETASPHWVRIEVEVKPDKRRRAEFAFLEPSSLFCCGWVSSFMSNLFVQDLARVPVGYRRVQTTDARQKRWMIKACRKIMLSWMNEFDSPEEWGRHMSELAEKQETF